jgi:arylsulfatase A-like enzyme
VAKGARTDVTVSLIDIYPTLVEKCNLPAPHQKLEGFSLVSILKHPAEATDRTVYLPYMNRGEYAVMNRDWRYIHYDEKNRELYNVKEDPHEWNNLASDSQYADVIAELRKSAPTEFADPEPKLNSRRDLVIEGEAFRWEKGKGNYMPHPKYLPYTDPAIKRQQSKKGR